MLTNTIKLCENTIKLICEDYLIIIPIVLFARGFYLLALSLDNLIAISCIQVDVVYKILKRKVSLVQQATGKLPPLLRAEPMFRTDLT